MAKFLVKSIREIAGDLFPKYQGVVFEVETIYKQKIDNLLTRLERPTTRKAITRQERDEIRRLCCVYWYQSLGANFL